MSTTHSSNKNILIISDIHIPYENKNAIKIAIDYAKKETIHEIIINGDLLDFHQLSSFLRDPRKRDLQYELDKALFFLTNLRKQFPKAKITFKEGNHEERLKRYIFKNSELLKLRCLKIPELLKLKELDIEFVNEKKIIKRGKLNIMHGHELFVALFGVNTARSILQKTLKNVIVGHFHKSQEYIQRKLDGSILGCWCIGHLGEEHPDYMKYNQWNFGFCIVNMYSNGTFRVNNFKILNGKVF